MELLIRLATVLGSIFTAGLATVWFAGAVHAQGAHHETHPSISLPSQELLAGISHGATQGATAFLVGLVAFVALIWLPASLTEDVDQEKSLLLFCRWMWVSFGLLVVAGSVEVPVYAVRASGEALSFNLLAEALLDTRVGSLWSARLGLGLLVVTTSTYATRRRNSAYWWGAAVIAIFLLMTLTQQSHAAAKGGLLPFVADWLHIAAASVWVGGLLGFPILLMGPLRAVSDERRTKLLGRTVRRFSKVATLAVMSLLVTGLYAILLHVPTMSALIGTPYGRTLLVKLGLLVPLLAAGGINLVARGRGPFDRVVRFELILAVFIFVVTGFLTTLPPASAVSP
jgi:copper transport protein